jgi:hypothetical protein
MNLEELKAKYLEAIDAYKRTGAEHDKIRATICAAIEAIETEFEEDYSDLIHALEDTKLAVQTSEAMLRYAIVAEYDKRIAASDDPSSVAKTLGNGLSVRVTEKFTYAEADAIAWARSNAPILVRESIDAKQFEKMVESLNDRPSFGTIERKVTAVIKA